MALDTQELEKVGNFTFSYQETYRRMVKFYKDYVATWQNMAKEERSKCHDVSLTAPFINSLPVDSDDIFFVLDIAQLVVSSQLNDKELEFAYHLKDEHGIKLGMYAVYLLKQYDILKDFR